MNQAVKIILTQMEIHPEDFEVSYIYEEGLLPYPKKWEWMLDRIVNRLEKRPEGGPYNPFPFITDEEAALIYGKFMEIQEGVFTRTVMKTMMSKPKPEEEEEYLSSAIGVGSSSQTLSTAQALNPWGTQLNTLYGAQGPSPVNPIPTLPKITFDAAADAYEITYPNGFSHPISKSDVEDAPDSVRDLVNSLLTKP
jgi:hypothetical protein